MFSQIQGGFTTIDIKHKPTPSNPYAVVINGQTIDNCLFGSSYNIDNEVSIFAYIAKFANANSRVKATKKPISTKLEFEILHGIIDLDGNTKTFSELFTFEIKDIKPTAIAEALMKFYKQHTTVVNVIGLVLGTLLAVVAIGYFIGGVTIAAIIEFIMDIIVAIASFFAKFITLPV